MKSVIAGYMLFPNGNTWAPVSCSTSNCNNPNPKCQIVRALLVHADQYAEDAIDVQSKLMALGTFAAADIWDANNLSPALADLQPYDVVLAWSEGYLFKSAAQLGDVLAQYWDNGGAVVAASGSLYSGQALQGKFGTTANGYMLIDNTAAYDNSDDQLGNVLEPASPLMAGVYTLAATGALKSTGAVVNGGVRSARRGASRAAA